MDPARAAELRRQLSAIAATLFDAVLAPAKTSDPSTGQASPSERMMMRVLRPWIPKLRDALLSKLSEADPVNLEVLVGATATALESILYYAPGDALPRFRFEWRIDEATGRPDLSLVPREAPAAIAG
jgi:hypothetical protein